MSETTETTRPRPKRPHKGEELDLEVDALAQGGRGIARSEGYVVFVAGALPGDKVRARVTKPKRSYAEATAIELLKPSPDRVPDTCVHGGEPCPGAPWQGLGAERQLAEKQAAVDDALRRLGGLDGFELRPILAAPDPWRYRNKLEYSFGPGPEGAGAWLGFHRRGSWKDTVDVDDCKLASEANNAARNRVREWAHDAGIDAYDRRVERGTLRNLVVREGTNTGELQTRLVTSATEIPRPPVDLHTIIDGPGGGTDGPTGVLGAEYISERIGELEFRVSPTAFLQTNTPMAERLYDLVAEAAELGGTERVFDLYCGIGTIGLSLARRCGEVWGVEIVPDAIADAKANAERNGIVNAHFRAADARLGLRPLIEEAGRADTVIIDPPRAGLSAKIVRRVIECGAKRIVYVSCNPTTLAPNAAQLGEAGYRLVSAQPVDMFPQTPHVECVAVLERG
ncbi:23S rRNA (uracil(1939)-C(5))-methyltransferase RlmD [Thermoleophilia bacterium SCSIO 60948]|nr:23S rRNA (uracil(1939)-C(5))-methyltransferase RlmD [Thermoleophilia bacterium SCSIO 60948]